MIDVLFYAPDVDAVIPELMQKLPEALRYDENGNPVDYAISRTPAKRKQGNGASLTLARLTDEEWEKFQNAGITTLEVLASGVDPMGQVLALDMRYNALKYYREVWPETWSYIDPDTQEIITVTNPDRFGGFAGDHYD